MVGWHNGKVTDADSILVPVSAHCVGRGSALFEVFDMIETDDGPAFFRAMAHFDRLFESARRMHMELPYSRKELFSGMAELARSTGEKRGAIKVLAYYCNPEFGAIPKDKTVAVSAFFYTVEEALGTGYERCILPVSAGVSSVRKLSSDAFDPHAKVAGHYVNAFHAAWEAVQKGYKQPIMLDSAGNVAEGALCSFFIVRNGTLITSPPDGVLLGITRDSVISIAEKEKVPCRQTDYSPEDARSADEAFVTGTIIRIQPISSIDGKPVGDGKVGPVTRQLQKVMEEVYCGRDRRFADWIEKI